MTHCLASQICSMLSSRFNHGFEFQVVDVAPNSYHVCVRSFTCISASVLEFMFSLSKVYDLSFGLYPGIRSSSACVEAFLS